MNNHPDLHFVEIPKVSGKPVKGPRAKGWNLPRTDDNPHGYTADRELVKGWRQAGSNIGLALKPSGLMTLDVDDLDETRRIASELDIPLDDWLNDPGRVEIQSGREGRRKLLFRVPADCDCITGVLSPNPRKF